MGHGDTTYRDLLTYACAIAGNERLLAERLGVELPQVLNWTMGIDQVPAAIFLKAVDIVSAATPEEIRRSREVLMRLQNRPANQAQKSSRDAALGMSARPSTKRNAEGPSGQLDS